MAAKASRSKDTNLTRALPCDPVIPQISHLLTSSPFTLGGRISTHEFVGSYSVCSNMGYSPSAWHVGITQPFFLILVRGPEGRTLLTINICLDKQSQGDCLDLRGGVTGKPACRCPPLLGCFSSQCCSSFCTGISTLEVHSLIHLLMCSFN